MIGTLSFKGIMNEYISHLTSDTFELPSNEMNPNIHVICMCIKCYWQSFQKHLKSTGSNPFDEVCITYLIITIYLCYLWTGLDAGVEMETHPSSEQKGEYSIFLFRK